MAIAMDNGFSVEISTHPKKNKKNSKVYDLYLLFTITQNGLPYGVTEFSTYKSCSIDMWGNPRIRLKGSSTVAKAVNDSLIEYETKAKNVLIDEKSKLKNFDSLKFCIQTVVRTAVTGKAARGQKLKQKEKMKELSLENLITRIKKEPRRNKKKLSESRRNMYDSVYELLKEYFEDGIPLLPNITKSDMKEFSNWYYNEYTHSAHTRSTYLGVVTAMFNSAVDYELIPFSPIPTGFTPSVKNCERKDPQIIEDDEVKRLYHLDDERLTNEERIAKYVMIFQLTTGISYCDVKTLQREHKKKNRTNGNWILKKQRVKTGEWFTVELSEKGYFSYQKLVELTGGEEYIFSLPKLRKMNDYYEKLADYADVPRFTSYDLRHSFAVHFMDAGGRLEDCQ